jgi:hypothetical protein
VDESGSARCYSICEVDQKPDVIEGDREYFDTKNMKQQKGSRMYHGSDGYSLVSCSWCFGSVPPLVLWDLWRT